MKTWIDPRIKREGWPTGEWDGEPDKAQWKDEATGLDCLAKRNGHMGNWCGYVGVTAEHPWFGKDYSDLPNYGPEVHGGLTYADRCDEDASRPMESRICHTPGPGEPDHLWWFGFDCAHAWDESPGLLMRELRGFDPHSSYKSLAYVQRQCTKLAEQLKVLQ